MPPPTTQNRDSTSTTNVPSSRTIGSSSTLTVPSPHTINRYTTSPTEVTPLLRARYSTGYNEPPPRFGLPPLTPLLTRVPFKPEDVSLDGMFRLSPLLSSGSSSMGFGSGSSPSLAAAFANASGRATRSVESTAWVLVALLWLYTKGHPSQSPASTSPSRAATQEKGTMERWSEAENKKKWKNKLESVMNECWNSFVDVHATSTTTTVGSSPAPRTSTDSIAPRREKDAVEKLLWTNVALDEEGFKYVRVIDLIVKPNAPKAFISHPLIIMSMTRVWSYGFPSATRRSWYSNIIERIATPQIAHASFLLYHLTYIFLLCNLVLEAPTSPIYIKPIKRASFREYFILFYSIFSLRASISTFPFALVTFSIALSLPRVPLPNTGPHSLLLLALSLLLLQLHLPRPTWLPSPIWCVRASKGGPLAVVVWSLLDKAVFPGLGFFGITVAILFVLLSIALGDTFPLTVNDLWAYVEKWLVAERDGEFKATTGPSHPQTRLTLLLLFVIACGATIMLTHALVLIFPSTIAASSSSPISSGDPDSIDSYDVDDEKEREWDRFGSEVGLVARRAFLRVVTRYAIPPSSISSGLQTATSVFEEDEDEDEVIGLSEGNRRALPPIVNFLGWILGTLPAGFARVVHGTAGHEESGIDGGRRAMRIEEAVRKWLWRTFVGFPGVIVAGIWLWR